MSNALIGHTGFVGSNLVNQLKFATTFNSRNIHTIKNRKFDCIYCAAMPAAKWYANQNPDKDAKSLQALINSLATVKSDRFVLISTIDVYPSPFDVHENSGINISDAHTYGLNRYKLEEFINSKFNSTIVRLPGLFGTGLKKNIIYDFLNNNEVQKIDSRSVFQFYNLDYLAKDIAIAVDKNLKIINFSSAPVSVKEVAKASVGLDFNNKQDNPVVRYNVKSNHDTLYGGKNGYLYSRNNILDDIAKFALKNTPPQSPDN